MHKHITSFQYWFYRDTYYPFDSNEILADFKNIWGCYAIKIPPLTNYGDSLIKRNGGILDLSNNNFEELTIPPGWTNIILTYNKYLKNIQFESPNDIIYLKFNSSQVDSNKVTQLPYFPNLKIIRIQYYPNLYKQLGITRITLYN
jgi:hypothetical protein